MIQRKTQTASASRKELRRFNRNNLLISLCMIFMYVLVIWGVYGLDIMTLNNQDNGARSLIPSWWVSSLIVVSALGFFAAVHWFLDKKRLCVKRRVLEFGLLDDIRMKAVISRLSDSELVTLCEASLQAKSPDMRVHSLLWDELLQRDLVPENDSSKSLIVSNGTVKNIGLFHRVLLGSSFFVFYRELESYGYLVRFNRIQSVRRLSEHTVGVWGIAANIIEIKLDDVRYREPLKILPRYIAGWESTLASAGYSLTETQ